MLPSAILLVLTISAGAYWLWSALSSDHPIVAVVRFDNETADPQMTRFSDGLTDNVVEQLTSRSNGRYMVVGNARILRLAREQRDLGALASSLHAKSSMTGCQAKRCTDTFPTRAFRKALFTRLRSGVEGVMQSTAGAWGAPMFATRIAGTRGTVRVEFDTVWVDDAGGSRQVPVPDDLVLPPPDPPPGDLLVTAYDQLHAFGIDLPPYTKLAQAFAGMIAGQPVPADPPPATFADGVADMAVLDAIRRSAADRRWVEVETP